jgi:hypothetical protein
LPHFLSIARMYREDSSAAASDAAGFDPAAGASPAGAAYGGALVPVAAAGAAGLVGPVPGGALVLGPGFFAACAASARERSERTRAAVAAHVGGHRRRSWW